MESGNIASLQSGGGNGSKFFPVWLYRVGRIVLAGVFLWSGIAKIQDPRSFAVIIEAFGLLPEIAIEPISLLLPILEIAAAVGILLDVKGSLGMITGMLVLFIFVLGYGLHMGLDVDCGCFGPDDPEAEAFHSLRPALYRDFVMMAGVAYLYIWRYARSVRPVRPVEILTVWKKGNKND
ncbi:Methylamine utilisation protein MauE [Desulfatibacillum alkenivorans DSM 16219]|jgi:uncharacterized membrane protein YphA (DoxX/SURF4 family)|uniref:Methylamine utilisation protein MauE n=1 Tax=Desulfatibacillum alkenivorans DSM 16219 TaxID=1121393 RepID=A0A1M6YWP7_9BACT|nr:MauE/DoxX family redox-associated membrane protein [Desulfatibacillum alkenivorans]SHL22706.1 Methylamine utilisation protein MauE [Desulfatibacillum alkenivorans DSM 16219]